MYLELNDEVFCLLNGVWKHEPNLKFACAQALAGAILLNTSSGVAIMVNTVEMYGATKSIDIHRDVSASTGSPLPPAYSIYNYVWPCVLNTRDGRKLTLWTSLKLVRHSHQSISLENTKIFIDKESWDKANALASITEVHTLHTACLIEQMRQLRSQFHHSTSYMLCRASSHVGMGRFCRPFTVSTYADTEGVKKPIDEDNSSMIASRIFSGNRIQSSPDLGDSLDSLDTVP
ncbi:hypothetical protein A0J61_05776 [Choanephora cucurbitarum]|uniref:Uncharacterized protein n=1 Tax=Choanephora cucurbitarum TaxID=101091 RepID=A0A1C7NAQ8_9FUNG|nr:hypothetical protein A0J61_05776 [Choanephora cucurbitarum]